MNDKTDELWDVVERESVEDEFVVRKGFELVEISEDNFRNYVSKIQHLLTDDVGEKMQAGLIGFVKSNGEKSENGKEHEEIVDHDIDSCNGSPDLCCPDSLYPAHGPGGLGCCAQSTFGCCPDNITPAPAPFFDVSPLTNVSLSFHDLYAGL